MASDNEASCESDPNFAVICAFLEKFGGTCGLNNIDFLDLQEMLENTQEVSQELIELHIKLLRKARKSVSSERWERAIIKLCHGFCSQDAWEIERFGYKKARISSKLRILKELLEMQFDFNAKFKNDINKMSAEELRTQPLGRDRMGNIYWFQTDESCQIRVYKEDPDEETWSLVAKDKEGLIALISQLTSNDTVKIGTESITNEDSNSLVEKPIIDTGQQDSNSSTQQSKSSSDETGEMGPTDSTKDSELKQQPEEEEEKEEIHPKLEEAEKVQPTTVESKVTEEPKENCAKSNSNISESQISQEPIDSVLNLSNKPSPIQIENTLDLSTTRKDKDDNSGIDLSINKTKFKPTGTETRSECVGIRNKYMRPEIADINTRVPLNVPAFGNPVFPLRKAIHSAGFDTMDVQNCLKRPLEEEIEEPSDLNRGHLNRPSLLSNKKRKTYSDDDEDDEDKSAVDESAGPTKEDNDYVSEAIEEPVMYVHGEGNGRDCETGNESKQTENDSNEQSSSCEKSDILNSINADLASPSKYQYKLGTIIDVKTDKLSNIKSSVKNSRWDIGKPELNLKDGSFNTTIEEKANTNQSLDEKSPSNEPKKMTFFFGPSSRQFTPNTIKVLPTFAMSFGQKPSEEISEPDKSESSNSDNCAPSIKINDNVDDKVPITSSAYSEPTPTMSTKIDSSENVPEMKIPIQDSGCDIKTTNDVVSEFNQELCSSVEADDTSSDEVIASSDKEEENAKLDDFQEIKKGMTSEIASQFRIDSEQSNEEDSNNSPATANDNYESSTQQSVNTLDEVRQPTDADNGVTDVRINIGDHIIKEETQSNIQQATEIIKDNVLIQDSEPCQITKQDIKTEGTKDESQFKKSSNQSSIVEYSDSEPEETETLQDIKENISDTQPTNQNFEHRTKLRTFDSLEESLAKLHGEHNTSNKESENVDEPDEGAREIEFCSVFKLNKGNISHKNDLAETFVENNVKTPTKINEETEEKDNNKNRGASSTNVEESRTSEGIQNEQSESTSEKFDKSSVMDEPKHYQESYLDTNEIQIQDTTKENSTKIIISQIESEVMKMHELQKNAEELKQSVENIEGTSGEQLERNSSEIVQTEVLKQQPQESNFSTNIVNSETFSVIDPNISENQEHDVNPHIEICNPSNNEDELKIDISDSNNISTFTQIEEGNDAGIIICQEGDALPVPAKLDKREEHNIVFDNETTIENNNIASDTLPQTNLTLQKDVEIIDKNVIGGGSEEGQDNFNKDENKTNEILIEDISVDKKTDLKQLPLDVEELEVSDMKCKDNEKIHKTKEGEEVPASKLLSDVISSCEEIKKFKLGSVKTDAKDNYECENRASVYEDKHQNEDETNVIRSHLHHESPPKTKQIVFEQTSVANKIEEADVTAQICKTEKKEEMQNEIQLKTHEQLFPVEESETSVEEIKHDKINTCDVNIGTKIVEREVVLCNETVASFKESEKKEIKERDESHSKTINTSFLEGSEKIPDELKQTASQDDNNDNKKDNKIDTIEKELKILVEDKSESRQIYVFKKSIENVEQAQSATATQNDDVTSVNTVSTEKVKLGEKIKSTEEVKITIQNDDTLEDKIVSSETLTSKSLVEEIKTIEVIEKTPKMIDQKEIPDISPLQKNDIKETDTVTGIKETKRGAAMSERKEDKNQCETELLEKSYSVTVTDENTNKDTTVTTEVFVERKKENDSRAGTKKLETDSINSANEEQQIPIPEKTEAPKISKEIKLKDTVVTDQNKKKSDDVVEEKGAKDTSVEEKSKKSIEKTINIDDTYESQSLEKTDKNHKCNETQNFSKENIVVVQKVTDSETEKQPSLDAETNKSSELTVQEKIKISKDNAGDEESVEKITLINEEDKISEESLITPPDKIISKDGDKIELANSETVRIVDNKIRESETVIEKTTEDPLSVDSLDIFSGTLKKIPELTPNEEEVDPLGDIVEKISDEVPMERPKGIKIVSLDKLIDNSSKQPDIVEFQQYSDSDNQFDSSDLVKPANEGLMLQIQDVRTITDDEEEFEQFDKLPVKSKNKVETTVNLRRSTRANRSASIIEIDSDEEAAPKKIRTQGRGGNRQCYKSPRPEIKVAERQKTLDSLSKMKDITVHSVPKINMPNLPASITVAKARQPIVDDVIEIESDDSTDSLIKVPNLRVPKSLGMEIRITRPEQKPVAIKEEQEEKEVTITRMSTAKKVTQQPQQQKLLKKPSDLEVDPLAIDNHELPKYFQGNQNVIIQKVDKVEIIPKEKIPVSVVEKRMPIRRTRNSKGSLEEDKTVSSQKATKNIDIIDHNQVFNRIPITAKAKPVERKSSTENTESLTSATTQEVGTVIRKKRGRPRKSISNDSMDKSLGNEKVASPTNKVISDDIKQDCDADQDNKNVRSLRHKTIELSVVTKKSRKKSSEVETSEEKANIDNTLQKENEAIPMEEDTKTDRNADNSKPENKSNYSPKHLRYRRVVELTPPIKKTKTAKQNEQMKLDNSVEISENKQNSPKTDDVEKDDKMTPISADIPEKSNELVSDDITLENENKVECSDSKVKGIPKKKRRGRPRKRVVHVIKKSTAEVKEESTEVSSAKVKKESTEVPKEESTEVPKAEEKEESTQVPKPEEKEESTQVPKPEEKSLEKKVEEAKMQTVQKLQEDMPQKDTVQAEVITENVENCSNASDNAVAIIETKPLAVSKEEIKTVSQSDQKQNEQSLTMATFKLDIEELLTPNVIGVKRKRDKGSTENEEAEADETVGKRPKMRGKRIVDLNLRHSVEEKKMLEISSSSDDDNRCDVVSPPYLVSEDDGEKNDDDDDDDSKKMPQLSKENNSPALSGDSRTETTTTPPVKTTTTPRKKKKRTLLGLEVPSDFNHEEILQTSGVRQSRRIAQLKIKEEAERRKLEEIAMADIAAKVEKQKKSKKDEDKDYKSTEKRKRHKVAPTDEETTVENEIDDKKKRKKRKKHKDPRKLFDESNPWRSSSESSTSNEEDEEDEIVYYSDDDLQLFKSDHEFSPESDMEENGEVQPMKRARTARKESDVEEVDDCACQKCGQSDHPEWILLCDRCDNGWHCSCLRPALLVIPEGDWFCPPCQHSSLIENLQNTLSEYNQRLKRRDLEERRKERLAYVGISLNNVLPPSKESGENAKHKSRHNFDKEDNIEEEEDESEENDNDNDDDEEVAPIDQEEEESESDESESESETESSSSSSSESEPVYQLRERRQAHSYRFTDYDNLINSAIQDEMEAVKGAGNQGRGKDISTIVNAEKEEEAARLKAESERLQSQIPTDLPQSEVAQQQQEQQQEEELPRVVPIDTEARPLEKEDSDDEPIRPVKKKHIGRKKHKKLNSLDVSSEDDDTESDEDFRGSSSSNEDEEDIDEEDLASESSEDSGRRRYKNSGPIRRSTRARIARYDREFINDDSDDDAPRRKKVRQFWDDEDSESEESDRSWGRRKRRARQPRRKSTSSANKKQKVKKKKKKKTLEDSDPEVFKQRKPKIKFGNLNEEEEEIGRRTRGKKINYLEALGSDSDDDVSKRPVPKPIPSDEEYVANEEELKNINSREERVLGNYSQNVPQVLPPINLQTAPPPPPPPYTGNYMTSKPLESGALPLISPQDSALLAEFGSQDMDEEPNPIEVMNKNLEEMNESEMEKMMEEEEYATKQLQLVALQIEKEKKRKEREAKKLEMLAQQEQKGLKKNVSGNLLPEEQALPSLIMSSAEMHNNAELSEPPGVSLPLFGEINPDIGLENTPKKRRGRGKGKKTIAAEAAAAAAAAEQAAAAAAAAACREKLLNSDPKMMSSALSNVDSSNSSRASPAPDSPLHGKLGIAAPPQPFSQSQPTPSVITRMLQSQPGQSNYPKYFAGLQADQPGTVYPSTISVTTGIPVIRNQFITGVQRPPASTPYHQTPPAVGHYPVVRSGPPPHQLRSPGPQNIPQHLYQSQAADRNSPTIASPASAGSPLNNKSEPPPPPYPRPQMVRFPPVSGNTPPISLTQPQRHQQLPMIPPPHLQQPRPTNLPPYHHTVPPPNYYGSSYPAAPPPALSNNEEALPPTVYQNSPYAEQFSGDGQPSENSNNSKSFDDETGGGEFGGLVSYFSSQREDDLDT